jgi:[NiFe] hydrogenase diaphorase moiety small subunit
MVIQNKTSDIEDLRKAIIELMFVEGNHFCPSCERSGNCELQALAYRYKVLVPRFNFQFNQRAVEASHPKLIKDHNRCILCKRCIRAIKDDKDRSIFAFGKRGHHVEIKIDTKLSKDMTDEQALVASEICPVGAILLKERGFKEPIGKRKYDHVAIGTDIETLA